MTAEDSIDLLARETRIDALECECARWGEAHQINLEQNRERRRAILAGILANGGRCTCQVSQPRCPCMAGVRQARERGECACRLFNTQDARC